MYSLNVDNSASIEFTCILVFFESTALLKCISVTMDVLAEVSVIEQLKQCKFSELTKN